MTRDALVELLADVIDHVHMGKSAEGTISYRADGDDAFEVEVAYRLDDVAEAQERIRYLGRPVPPFAYGPPLDRAPIRGTDGLRTYPTAWVLVEEGRTRGKIDRVKEIRARTSCGLSEAKAAEEAADGDVDLAVSRLTGGAP